MARITFSPDEQNTPKGRRSVYAGRFSCNILNFGVLCMQILVGEKEND